MDEQTTNNCAMINSHQVSHEYQVTPKGFDFFAKCHLCGKESDKVNVFGDEERGMYTVTTIPDIKEIIAYRKMDVPIYEVLSDNVKKYTLSSFIYDDCN